MKKSSWRWGGSHARQLRASPRLVPAAVGSHSLCMKINQSVSLSLSTPTLNVLSGQGTLKAAGRQLVARLGVLMRGL